MIADRLCQCPDGLHRRNVAQSRLRRICRKADHEPRKIARAAEDKIGRAADDGESSASYLASVVEQGGHEMARRATAAAAAASVVALLVAAPADGGPHGPTGGAVKFHD